jgi:folate-binding protein YgfZ
MTSAALSPAYRAAREHAGLIVRTSGLIVVSGRDRASYLQGLLTNDITALAPGHGCYAAYLTPQGRMIADLHVYELGDVILLVLPPAAKDDVLARLDQFIFSEDVQLGDVTDAFASLVVVGPDSAAVAAAVTDAPVDSLQSLPVEGCLRTQVAGDAAIVLRVNDTGEPGLALLVAHASLEAVAGALRAAGAADVDPGTADVLRIEDGVPRFGQDMTADTIPLEAGIEERAISFTKGCYVGQEVIIRVLHRGHGRVARRLMGLVFDAGAGVPPPGTSLHHDGAQVGAVTSSAESPALGRPIAMGYVKRDLAVADTMVSTADGAVARVVPLPFARA